MEGIDPTARFAELVAAGDGLLGLDEVCWCLAAHAHPGLPRSAVAGPLDDLAASCAGASLGALVHHLFVRERFAGNRDDYYDPRNSYLDDVLARRLGIPITLSVVAIEVGRRLGLGLDGVGMPGHFLVRDRTVAPAFVDCFDQGAVLDRDGCVERWSRVQGGDPAHFRDEWLVPVGPVTIVNRMLANLKAVHTQRGDAASLAWVLRLRTLLPGADPGELAEYARLMARFN